MLQYIRLKSCEGLYNLNLGGVFIIIIIIVSRTVFAAIRYGLLLCVQRALLLAQQRFL